MGAARHLSRLQFLLRPSVVGQGLLAPFVPSGLSALVPQPHGPPAPGPGLRPGLVSLSSELGSHRTPALSLGHGLVSWNDCRLETPAAPELSNVFASLGHNLVAWVTQRLSWWGSHVYQLPSVCLKQRTFWESFRRSTQHPESPGDILPLRAQHLSAW